MATNVMDSFVTSLEQDILNLGELVQTAIGRAVTSLLKRDDLLARSVIRDDEIIDRAEVEVQEECLRILENERPTGSELRFVVAVLKINDSLERIGDLAESVAETVVEIGSWERFQQVVGINKMADLAQNMVKDSLAAFVNRDSQFARQIIASAGRLHAAQQGIIERIQLELDRVPEYASPLMRLEHVMRQFERVGDISCNIAEEVIYLVEGMIVRHRLSI